MEAHIRSEQSQQISQGSKMQDGDPRNNPDLPPGRGVGYVHRLQGRLLPHTHTNSLQEIPEISCRGQDISSQGTSLWPIHSTTRVYSGSQGGKVDGPKEGYKNPPVPRRLVGPGHIPPNLSLAYPDASITVSGPRLGGKFRKIRAGTQAGVRLFGLSVRPSGRQGQTHFRPVGVSQSQNKRITGKKYLSGLALDVPYRAVNSHRKTGPSGKTPHETHTVASQKQLEGPRVPRKGDSSSQIPPPPSKVVARRKQCAARSTITPSKTCAVDLYRRIKRRVGRSLRRAHCKGNLVPSRKQVAHKPLRAKSSISSSKRVSNPRLQQDSVDSYRQQDSGCLYQQRGGG